MPERETDFHYGFVAGILLALLVMWWMRHRKRKRQGPAPAVKGSSEVVGVSTPGVVSGPGPTELHSIPTSV
jgi:hypothetical protein